MDGDVPWSMLRQELLVYFQNLFKSPRPLQAAFDTEDDCCELINSAFPLMVVYPFVVAKPPNRHGSMQVSKMLAKVECFYLCETTEVTQKRNLMHPIQSET